MSLKGGIIDMANPFATYRASKRYNEELARMQQELWDNLKIQIGMLSEQRKQMLDESKFEHQKAQDKEKNKLEKEKNSIAKAKNNQLKSRTSK